MVGICVWCLGGSEYSTEEEGMMVGFVVGSKVGSGVGASSTDCTVIGKLEGGRSQEADPRSKEDGWEDGRFVGPVESGVGLEDGRGSMVGRKDNRSVPGLTSQVLKSHSLGWLLSHTVFSWVSWSDGVGLSVTIWEGPGVEKNDMKVPLEVSVGAGAFASLGLWVGSWLYSCAVAITVSRFAPESVPSIMDGFGVGGAVVGWNGKVEVLVALANSGDEILLVVRFVLVAGAPSWTMAPEPMATANTAAVATAAPTCVARLVVATDPKADAPAATVLATPVALATAAVAIPVAFVTAVVAAWLAMIWGTTKDPSVGSFPVAPAAVPICLALPQPPKPPPPPAVLLDWLW